MGLDACVFVGEEDVSDSCIVSERLGNVSLIGSLWHEVHGTGEQFPILLDRVLYGGTPTGDCLDGRDLSALAEELSRLKARSGISQNLTTVVAQLENLLRVATSHRKPITFV